jgi:hypothetical protein
MVANTFIDLELVCLFVLCWGTVVVWSGSLNINGNRQNNRYFCSKFHIQFVKQFCMALNSEILVCSECF